MSLTVVVVGVTICLLIFASCIFSGQKCPKVVEEEKENSSKSKLVLHDSSSPTDAVKPSSFSNPVKMTIAEYEEQGVRETNAAMDELRKIIENSANPLKLFMKFDGETRAKLLDFKNSGEHLPVEENENLPVVEIQNFETGSETECEKGDQVSTPRRKFESLNKGYYESPKRYPSFIHPSFSLNGQAN